VYHELGVSEFAASTLLQLPCVRQQELHMMHAQPPYAGFKLRLRGADLARLVAGLRLVRR